MTAPHAPAGPPRPGTAGRPAARREPWSGRRRARVAGVALAALALPAEALQAQPDLRDRPAHRHVAVHPLVGAFVPLGRARERLADGPAAGAQVGVGLPAPFGLPTAAVVTVLGARSRQADGAADPAAAGRRGVAIYGYDVGLEFGGRLARVGPTAHAPTVLPFVGVGGGGRTLNPDARGAPSRTGGAGYASLGAEWVGGGGSRTAVRLDTRAYWSTLDPRAPEDRRRRPWRTDLVLSAGLAYHFR